MTDPTEIETEAHARAYAEGHTDGYKAAEVHFTLADHKRQIASLTEGYGRMGRNLEMLADRFDRWVVESDKREAAAEAREAKRQAVSEALGKKLDEDNSKKITSRGLYIAVAAVIIGVPTALYALMMIVGHVR